MDGGMVTTWVGRDALMWASKTRAQLLKAQLKEWDDLDQVLTMVTAIEQRSGIELTAAKTKLRDEEARKLAHRLVWNDWIARRHAAWAWAEGTLLTVGTLLVLGGGGFLLTAPPSPDAHPTWPASLTVILVGVLILACPLAVRWLMGHTSMVKDKQSQLSLKDKQNQLYKALLDQTLVQDTEETPDVTPDVCEAEVLLSS